MIYSLLESLYLYYMFNIFKTKFSIHHPFEYLATGFNFIKHPISSNLYENKICPLGNLVGKLAIFWFIGRHFINKDLMIKLNRILIGILVISSLLMNMNAFIASSICMPSPSRRIRRSCAPIRAKSRPA